MHNHRFLKALSFLAITACSTSGGGGGGDPFRSGFPTTDVIWYQFTGPTQFQVRLTDYSGACPIEQASVSHKANSRYGELTLQQNSGTTILPGTYAIGTTGTVQGAAKTKGRDATCNSINEVKATGGTITTVDTFETGAAVIRGSYDLTFEDGSTATGSFSANFCNIAVNTGASTCVP